MIVLGLDAGLGGFSAAVARGAEPLAAVELPGHVALEQGLGALTMVMQQAGVGPQDVERIAVGVGPGSFTGVRIAISYAKSLAQGWRKPLAGVNSFDALEAGLQIEEPLLCVVHGRAGVVSVRLRTSGRDVRASGYIRDVVGALGPAGGRLLVLGDTQDVLEPLAERGWQVEPVHRVIEPAALAVAAVAAEREPARSFHEVRADYGELPAAKIPKIPGLDGEKP